MDAAPSYRRFLRVGSPAHVESVRTPGHGGAATDEESHGSEGRCRGGSPLRDAAESLWTPERLKEHVRCKLGTQSLVIVSNREPYIHIRKGREIHCTVPASGVVTATEPVLPACGGTWIAYGGGDADRATADPDGRLKAPPDDPRYTLRRIWLTAEEVEGHYDGFSNEGLWPLCHIAHTRPSFETGDWDQYQAVNARFADAAVEEFHGVRDPCVLVHDYHFALVPAGLLERFRALEMRPGEVRTRMAAMRRHVKEANVYRWAGNVLSELCDIGSARAPQPPSA